jgi:hypothetical protein
MFKFLRLRLSADVWAGLGLLGLLFIFYPDLFLVKAAPLTGDHLEQHYPWAYLLARSIKQFSLPVWTPLIQCGFPLAAESQVGAFYLPNLIVYFFLPFHTAYSYMNLLHWFVAGWGTYWYAKKMNLGAVASFIAAIIFVFGSAYGGAYYNMTSLKTICWFPFALYFLEQYFSGRQRRFLVGMAILISQSVVAGYLQMAVFTWMIFGVYLILRIFIFRNDRAVLTEKVLILGSVVAAILLALLGALPQLFMTFQLAGMSNRVGIQEGYAYVGSMSPLILGTLLNPNFSLISSGSNLYAGYFTLFLVLVSFLSPEIRKSLFFRLWATLALVALLLALGRWSPLYVAFVKSTHFYAFRVPAKFLGFFCFGLAMLGALGFQALWQGKLPRVIIQRAFVALISILAVCVAAVVTLKVFLTSGRNMALELGKAYVLRYVYLQPGHPRSLESYFATVKAYPDHILKFLSWNDPANICAAIAAIFCILLIWFFLRKGTVSRVLLGVAGLFLVVDLYAAAFLDIKQDLASYKSTLVSSSLVNVLAQEKAVGRLGRVYGFRSPSQQLPLLPSMNMLFGIDDIGIYSPFVMRRYYETIGLFGNINDSTLAITPTPEFVRSHLPLLSFLNVTHILSTEPLSIPELKPMDPGPDCKAFLYRNGQRHEEAYFIREVQFYDDWKDLKRDLLANDFDPSQTLLLEREELKKCGPEKLYRVASRATSEVQRFRTTDQVTRSSWIVTTSEGGFFVVPVIMFAGWKAKINGREVPILRAYGMFRSVYLSEGGKHLVEFEYHPFTKEGLA